MKNNFLLPIAIILSAVIVSGAILYTSNSRNVQGSIAGNTAPGGGSNIPPGDGREVKVNVTETDPTLGNPSAPVTMVAFEDFECPFCQRFTQQTLSLLKNQEIKEGKVRFVWKDFPLSIHSHAQRAHEAARCAWEQDKFWEYHDVLFDNQRSLNESDLKRHAKNLGLNESKFSSCLDSGKYSALIREKVSDGAAAGVSGTPSFLINGRVVVGAQPYQALADIIAQAIQ